MVVRCVWLLCSCLAIAGTELARAKAQTSHWRQLLRAKTELAQGFAQLMQGSKRTLVAALAATTLALSAPEALQARDWQRVNNRAAEHLKSSFYLVLDAGNLWRIMHIEYIGADEHDKPLFVGLYAFVVIRDGKGVAHDILDEVEASLVGHKGLIKQGVEVEVKQVFLHPDRRLLDIAVIALDGVDMHAYQPITIDLWPMKMLSELEMLSYRVDLAEQQLGLFGYPALRRSCAAGNFFINKGIAMHTCVVPPGPASVASPIFSEGSLVALHIGYNEDGLPYAAAVPPALVHFSDATLTVTAARKTTAVWGALKTARE